MRIKKTVNILLCIVLVMVFFSGCTRKIYLSAGLKDNEIFKLSGYTCTVGQMNIILSGIMADYEEVFGKELWQQAFSKGTFSDKLKNQAFSNMIDLYSLRCMADKESFIVTNEEKEAIALATDKFLEGLEQETIDTLQIQRSDVEVLYTNFILVENLYEKYTSEVNVEISDSSARVIRVQSIFTKDKVNAEEAYSQVTSGKDFSTIATKYSEDDTVEYTFGRGSMIEAYENVAFKLSIGEISEIIETEDGYYIIKCVSDYLEKETIKNKEKMIEQYKQDTFLEEYKPVKEKLSYELNDKVWKNISADHSTSGIKGFYESFYEFCK